MAEDGGAGADPGPSSERLPYDIGRGVWRDAMDNYHAVIEPLERRYDRSIDYAVEYSKAALRTALELNGGGLIALPSLGTLFGSIWSRGTLFPELGVLCFVAGLVAAALGYAFAFFHFQADQGWIVEQKTRLAASINKRFEATLSRIPMPNDDSTPTQAENRHWAWARGLQLAGIAMAITSLITFIAGATITAYVLAGGHASGGR
jgi:hypothetical protein